MVASPWVVAAAEALMAGGPLAVGVFDEELRHVAANARLARMNGQPVEALLGRTPVELHGPSVAEAEAMYRSVLDSREPLHGVAFTAALPDEPEFERHWVLACLPLPEDGPRGVVVVVEEVTGQVAAQQQRDAAIRELEDQTRRDPLTQLLNRAGLDHWWTERVAAGTPVELVYADLDGFKAVNDVAGHALGDEVLVRIAQAMEAVAYDDEVVARVGGDEFVGVTLADGDDLARRLQQAVQAVADDDARIGGITVSCGVGYVMPEEGLAVGLSRADAAMYRAKAAGSS